MSVNATKDLQPSAEFLIKYFLHMGNDTQLHLINNTKFLQYNWVYMKKIYSLERKPSIGAEYSIIELNYT